MPHSSWVETSSSISSSTQGIKMWRSVQLFPAVILCRNTTITMFSMWTNSLNNQYLTSMYHVCATMAARWPEELSQVKLETFTVDYQPCLQCINTDYQDAVYR